MTAKRKHRVHVLVCAPSNSALDEIVLRLMSSGKVLPQYSFYAFMSTLGLHCLKLNSLGLRDETGQTFIPSIVRIGVNPHHSIQSVSMDYLVGKWVNM